MQKNKKLLLEISDIFKILVSKLGVSSVAYLDIFYAKYWPEFLVIFALFNPWMSVTK